MSKHHDGVQNSRAVLRSGLQTQVSLRNDPLLCYVILIYAETELADNLFSRLRGEPTGTVIKVSGKWDAYVATADGESQRKKTALLLLPDVMGIWINSKLLADEFASRGYTCMVMDIFNGDSLTLNDVVTRDIPKWVSEGSNGHNPHTPEFIDPIVSAAIDTLKTAYGAARVGSAGYCFGAKVCMLACLLFPGGGTTCAVELSCAN